MITIIHDSSENEAKKYFFSLYKTETPLNCIFVHVDSVCEQIKNNKIIFKPTYICDVSDDIKSALENVYFDH